MAKVSLALVGDIMLGRTVDEYVKEEGPKYPWGDTLPLIKRADLALGNLECAITPKAIESEMPKPFYFRAGPEAADALKSAGIGCVSLANNHVLDYREEGMADTVRFLENAGIKHAGAGRNIREASEPAILGAKGIRIAVLSYADQFEEWEAGEARAGINYTPVTTDEKYFGKIRASISDAKKKSDFVVFSIHWGPNMRQYPTKKFVEFAHEVIDAGADIFHGHSAHVFQPVEVYKGRPVFYDCGDFVDDYAVDEDLRNDYALLILVIIDAAKKKVERIELIPCFIHSYKCQVNLAAAEEFGEIAKKVMDLSEFFGTKARVQNGRITIEI